MVFKHSKLGTVIQTLFIKLCYQTYILFLGLTIFNVCLNSLIELALSYLGLGVHWVELGTHFIKLCYQIYIYIYILGLLFSMFV